MEIEDVREIDGERYLAPKVAAAEFGYTKDQIGQMARLGSVDAKLIGRIWYIRERDLIERRERERAFKEAEEAEAARLKAEEEAAALADEEEVVEPEPEPEPMTFAKRLMARKVVQPAESVNNDAAAVDAEEIEITDETEEADASTETQVVERPRVSSVTEHASSVRSIDIRTRTPEMLRSERARGERHAKMLGSMDVRYERGERIEYEYEPVERTPEDTSSDPSPVRDESKRSIRQGGGVVLRTKRASAPHERPIRRGTVVERPAFDSIKRPQPQRTPVRVTESNRPVRAPDAELQRPRKKKKGKRVPKKKSTIKPIVIWLIIGVLVIIGLFIAVMLFENS